MIVFIVGFIIGACSLYIFVWWCLRILGPHKFILEILNHDRMTKEARLNILTTIMMDFCFNCGAACGDTTEEQHRLTCRSYAEGYKEPEEESCPHN
jgi:hypothetical protein